MKNKTSRLKKSMAIIGEGETEQFYFQHLVAELQVRRVHIKPQLPSHPDIYSIIKMAHDLRDNGYDYVVLVIDMDKLNEAGQERVLRFYKNEKAKMLKTGGDYIFIETMPCTEFWFLLHFWTVCKKKSYASCDDVIKELRKSWPQYEKSISFFRATNRFKFLSEHGSIDKSIAIARLLCSLREGPDDYSFCFSEIYKVIELMDRLSKE